MKTKIEWTESTWNPVTGCSKISPGCKHCYAERMAIRLQAMDQPRYQNGFQLTLHEDVVKYPLHWKKPQMIFVNSMSDLFHHDIPIEFIEKVFQVINQAEQHIFQILTKRSDRLVRLADRFCWSENIWMGVSIENQGFVYRIQDLCSIPAAVRFLSLEPLLGPIHLEDLSEIDWVIVGGESGPKARPMKLEWCQSIRDRCIEQQVPFFFKQWGGVNKKTAGRELDGKYWNQMPVAKAHRSINTVFTDGYSSAGY